MYSCFVLFLTLRTLCVLCCVVLCYVVLCCVVLCCVLSLRFLCVALFSCIVVLCCVVLCCVCCLVFCCVVLCLCLFSSVLLLQFHHHATDLAPILTCSGVIDIGLNEISSQQRAAFAAATTGLAKEPTLIVPCSASPSTSYNNPTLWTTGWPWLFTWGVGGPENESNAQQPPRRTKLSFERWLKHLANLHDRRFQLDHNMMLAAFNEVWRRKLLRRSRRVMEQPTSLADAKLIATLTADQTAQFAKLESENKAGPRSTWPPAIQALWRKLKTVGSTLPQTDLERAGWRHEITGYAQHENTICSFSRLFSFFRLYSGFSLDSV